MGKMNKEFLITLLVFVLCLFLIAIFIHFDRTEIKGLIKSINYITEANRTKTIVKFEDGRQRIFNSYNEMLQIGKMNIIQSSKWKNHIVSVTIE